MVTASERPTPARGLDRHSPAARPWLAWAVVSWTVVSWAAASGCARIAETRSLRVRALEPPRQVAEPRGVGFAASGQRDGTLFRVAVEQVERCATVTRQRAEGFERLERRAEGGTLVIQWAMGGLFSLAGGGIAAWTATHPTRPDADGALRPGGDSSAWLQAAILGGVGLALLAGSTVQQTQIGVSERSLGARELAQEGRIRVCRRGPAAAGTVRLTLPDGSSWTAAVGPDGRATIDLPADLEDRLHESDRRATLEVLGDWRSQVRVPL